MSLKSFFSHGVSGRLDPTPMALSLWGPDSLNGPAVCGAAAYVVERDHMRDGWLPARFTIELFKGARRVPTAIDTEVLRDGHRIRVVQVTVRQYADGDADGVVVAQGNTVFLRQADNPPGARWSRPATPYDVPETDPDKPRNWFHSEETGWTQNMADVQHATRRSMWTRGLPVLPDVPLTPFQRAVISAESTSLSTNWGEGGIGFINCDLTVAISRLPVGDYVGVESDSHLENDGVSVGTANLFDAEGQYGIGMVTAVENTRAMIDFAKLTPAMSRQGDELPDDGSNV